MTPDGRALEHQDGMSTPALIDSLQGERLHTNLFHSGAGLGKVA